MFEGQFEDKTIKKAQIYEQHKKCLGEREVVENEDYQRSPRKAVTEENIPVIHRLFKHDVSEPVSEFAFGVGICYATAQIVITDLTLTTKNYGKDMIFDF